MANLLDLRRRIKSVKNTQQITKAMKMLSAFNANLIKAAQAFLREHAGKTVELMAVGRKGRDFFRRREINIVQEYIGLTGKGRVSYEEASELAGGITRRF